MTRGTEPSPAAPCRSPRETPAGAGNSSGPSSTALTRAGDPRGCGEQTQRAVQIGRVTGRPPRVRGTARRTALCARWLRETPAGAGNRTSAARLARRSTGDPRGCGEQHTGHAGGRLGNGRPPRVRGTGLGGDGDYDGGRETPAGAGNRTSPSASAKRRTGDPRGCGEQMTNARASLLPRGRPPRVRGTDYESHVVPVVRRETPAGAGNSSPRTTPPAPCSGDPRGCGEQVR